MYVLSQRCNTVTPAQRLTACDGVAPRNNESPCNPQEQQPAFALPIVSLALRSFTGSSRRHNPTCPRASLRHLHSPQTNSTTPTQGQQCQHQHHTSPHSTATNLGNPLPEMTQNGRWQTKRRVFFPAISARIGMGMLAVRIICAPPSLPPPHPT